MPTLVLISKSNVHFKLNDTFCLEVLAISANKDFLVEDIFILLLSWHNIFLILLFYIDIPVGPSQGISPTTSGEYDVGTTHLITGLYHVLVTLSLYSTATQNTWRRGLALGSAPDARILHWGYQHVGILEPTQTLASGVICVTPDTNPRCQSVEYRWRWVPNANFLRWPCTFHFFGVDFIRVG